MVGLNSVPDVEIDPEGKFKYILVKISSTESESKLIVRGTKKAEFHPDIFAKVEPELKSSGFSCEVQGGGKIIHQPEGKSIKVFSKSTVSVCMHNGRLEFCARCGNRPGG
eukprot:GFUD01121032.1.p1 GENE.GFUD01121032.1~~GFUD01121032.1.p1  ORF type:complete len:123 (-),score=19.65 GFUD01121032.1:213-542(-)